MNRMDDLISRQAAITIPVLPKEHRKYKTMNLDDAYELGWFDCQNCIEKLPSAERRGRWKEEFDGIDTIYECSVCGEPFVTLEGTPADNLWNYCPNCGAKMDEVEE